MNIHYKVLIISLSVFYLISCGSKQKTVDESKGIMSNKPGEVLRLEPGSYSVLIDSSMVFWEGGKLSGSTHDGNLLLNSGSVIISDSKTISGEFIVDMTTMDCLDINNENSKNRLLDHLRSDDFFDVNNHREASLSINSSKNIGENNFLFSGDLTIKGITNPVEMKGKISNHIDSYAADIEMSFDRSKYNVKYKSISFFSDLGDNYILDNIDLSVSILTKKSL